MSGTDDDPTDGGEAVAFDADRFEQGAHAMTPDEAGIPSLAAVIAESQDIHEQVAGEMEGIEGFPEPEGD